MSYTTESMDPPVLGKALAEPSHFDLPTKEFIGYDPKGTTSITGSPLVNKQDVKQPETVEAEKPAEVPKEEIVASPKVSALIRKEQAQRQREIALKQRETQLADKLAKAEKYEALQAKIAAKDYSAVDELGLDYEGVTKHELDKQTRDTPEEKRLRAIEEENKRLKSAIEEKEVRDYQTNQSLWKQEIAKTIAENDEFIAIRKLKMEDAVLYHVNASFEEDNVELTVEQAAKEINAAILAQKKRLDSISEPETKDEKVLGPPAKIKTITNNMTTTPVKSMSKPFHLMSESEQLAEAIRRVQAAKLQR